MRYISGENLFFLENCIKLKNKTHKCDSWPEGYSQKSETKLFLIESHDKETCKNKHDADNHQCEVSFAKWKSILIARLLAWVVVCCIFHCINLSVLIFSSD